MTKHNRLPQDVVFFGVDCDNATLLPAMNCAGQF